MTDMEYLLQRFLYEIEKTDIESRESEKLIQKYAKMAEIQAQVKYGDVFAIKDFIDHVRTGGFIPYDGFGYYWDEEKQDETEFKTSFDVDELKKKAKQYKYVIWYNR